jgi:hypothetical protein
LHPSASPLSAFCRASRAALPQKGIQIYPAAIIEADTFIFEQSSLEFMAGAQAALAARVEHPVPGHTFRAFSQRVSSPTRFDLIVG